MNAALQIQLEKYSILISKILLNFSDKFLICAGVQAFISALNVGRSNMYVLIVLKYC